VPVPAATYFNSDALAATIPAVFPTLIKPNFGDSSIGTRKDAIVHSWIGAITCLGRPREAIPGRPILIQEFLPSPKYSVAMIGNPGQGFRVLPLLEVDSSQFDPALPRRLLRIEMGSNLANWSRIGYRKARLDEGARRKIIDYASIFFERLGCRDNARFDFRAADDGESRLLEVYPTLDGSGMTSSTSADCAIANCCSWSSRLHGIGHSAVLRSNRARRRARWRESTAGPG
jgi:D-alanine-D-alanine ligase